MYNQSRIMKKNYLNKEIIVTTNPQKIHLIFRIVYLVANLIINQALRGFIFAFSLFGNVEPNKYMNLVIGLVISEISYRTAVKIYQTKLNLLKSKLDNEPQEGINFVREYYVFLINASIATILNFIFFLGYFIFVKLNRGI